MESKGRIIKIKEAEAIEGAMLRPYERMKINFRN